MTTASEPPEEMTLEEPEEGEEKAPDADVATAEDEDEPKREVIDLLEPREGMPPVIVTAAELADAIERLAAGPGRWPWTPSEPRGTGTGSGPTWSSSAGPARNVLIDPIGSPDLSGLDAAMADVEAVLHAASQDLPCLAEIGYRPKSFDTARGAASATPVALGTMWRRCSASGWPRIRLRTGR